MGHTHHGKGKPKIFARTNEIIRGLNEKEGKDGTNLGCESNLEDYLERDDLGQEIDVVGIGQDGGEFVGIQKNEDREAMDEQSSSFGNTFSGSEDEVRSSSDVEADSQFANTPTSQFGQAQFAPEENRAQFVSGEFGRICKKRKVTAHWRKFIGPLMWRCQWLELQMNELRSQALLYDKELAKYEGEKQLQSKMIELDYSVSRLVPTSCQRHRKRVMERVKRKRIEDTTNISSYMSNHNLFSYYENKKRPETDCQSIDNDCDDRGG
ncbi:uncharacterized protein A4U43_C02F5470 [Asparagus officinalis]|uniref:Uncharacterized protein n=1 Tax=Asparagus officinalis TaxID=4686 RepID=A0A5P1FG34_ASPOF|nr:uncharacterized protein A4U43_C02F5470 [Asparagus officinalis]